MNYSEFITTSIATIGLVLGIYNIRLVEKTFKADHERRKKQATIEYVGQILREARFKIDAHYRSNKSLTDEQVSTLIANPADSAEWRNAIGVFEHLAVGINAGVYDKDILYRMAGGYITTLFTFVEPYIKAARKQYPRAYCEFQELAREFKKRHENNEPILGIGDIKHSRV